MVKLMLFQITLNATYNLVFTYSTQKIGLSAFNTRDGYAMMVLKGMHLGSGKRGNRSVKLCNET